MRRARSPRLGALPWPPARSWSRLRPPARPKSERCVRTADPTEVGGAALGRGHPRRHPARYSRAPPCTRATSTTCRPACGTPGPPTTRSPTASSSTRSSTSDDLAAARDARHQLRGVPHPQPPLRCRPSAPRRAWPSSTRSWPALCYPTDRTGIRGDSRRGARQPHRRSASSARACATARTSTSNYAAPDYTPVNDPLIVALPGTMMNDPEPLAAAGARGVVHAERHPAAGRPAGLRRARTGATSSRSRCRRTRPACRSTRAPPPLPPRPGDSDAAFKDAAVEVIRLSSELDPNDRKLIDISPARLGNNTLGTNDGDGLRGQPGDRSSPTSRTSSCAATSRAPSPSSGPTGPRSETPPGHWNTIANAVVDSPGFERRLGGVGRRARPARVGRQDVPRAQRRRPRRGRGRLGRQGLLRLGAAHLDDPLHGRPRPVERSRQAPPTTPMGLPLVAGLIEVITAESSAPGPAPRAPRRPRRRDRHPGLGRQPRGPRDPAGRRGAGSAPSNGCPTSSRPS